MMSKEDFKNWSATEDYFKKEYEAWGWSWDPQMQYNLVEETETTKKYELVYSTGESVFYTVHNDAQDIYNNLIRACKERKENLEQANEDNSME